MKCPETWAELKAELEASGLSADVIQAAAVGWAFAERATPGRRQVMATDRSDFINYQSMIEASAGSAMETLAIWKRQRFKCPTCEDAGSLIVNAGIQSRGPIRIEECPDCRDPKPR